MTVPSRICNWAIAFLVGSAFGGTASAADVSASALVDKGSLTYGVAATFAPFEYMDAGKMVGFDIDLIAAVAAKLSLKPVALNMEFKGLIPALQGKRVDVINSAMYITPQRMEQVEFVPYLLVGTQVVVAADNPQRITGRDESLCGKNIAVTLGGIQETYARADNERCLKAGMRAVNVMTLPTAQDSMLTLRAGRADVVFDSTPGTVKVMSELPGVFKTVGNPFEVNTRVGLAVRKGDTEIKVALESALKEVVADGTYMKLLAKWRFPESVAFLK